MLVATDKAKAAAARRPRRPSPGRSSSAPQSRIVMQPREEAVDVFYLLDIANSAQRAGEPAGAVRVRHAAGAAWRGIMQGSSPQASVNGAARHRAGAVRAGQHLRAGRVRAAGRERRASTSRSGSRPRSSISRSSSRKSGDTTLRSPQLKEQRELPADGEMFIAATGGAVAAGQPIELDVGGVPHHSPAPRRIALALALAIVARRRLGRRHAGGSRGGEGRGAQAADRAPREAVQRARAARTGSPQRPRSTSAVTRRAARKSSPRSNRSTALSTTTTRDRNLPASQPSPRPRASSTARDRRFRLRPASRRLAPFRPPPCAVQASRYRAVAATSSGCSARTAPASRR